MSLAVLFPGQGSIVPRSGAAWVDRPEWRLVAEVEDAADRPVAPLLLDDPAPALARTDAAQIATFTLSLMAWDALAPRLPEPPVAFAGHSLGQLTALVASGALDRREGIALVVARADACRAADERSPGRMSALLGADVEQAEAACAVAPGACWIANDNAPGQIVIGGTPEGLEAAIEAARTIGVRKAMPLTVGGAFHTPLMAPAVEAWQPVLTTASFGTPAVPIVDNTDAEVRASGEGWTSLLARHLVEPVRWHAVQRTLVERMAVRRFVELAPSGTLTALARRSIPDAEPLDVDALAGSAAR